MGMIDASVVRAHNVLLENAEPESIPGALVQTSVIGDSKRAGREYRRFLENRAKLELVVSNEHIIDCRRPSMPAEWAKDGSGWKVERHVNLGRQVFTPDAVRPYLADGQKGNRSVVGNKLRKIFEAAPETFLTDNWLDFLLAHPEFIPESWRGKAVFFWGTIYRDPRGGLYVRYLDWRGRQWGWSYYWLGHDWYSDFPAASLASI